VSSDPTGAGAALASAAAPISSNESSSMRARHLL
jgi:hypothetical protein